MGEVDRRAVPDSLDIDAIDASLRSLGHDMDRALRCGGNRCGSYTLLQEIGEGGYGEVHVAVQDPPLDRRVAVKILKRGLDTRKILRRFELEQRSLARIDHPNVATILDSGVTEDGRPWFAMPLLDGEAITVACDDVGAEIDERLHIFAQVCDGVQAAHVQGIVHRDLKPGNIIVIRSAEGVMVPKVIDFGIAKAVDDPDGMTNTVESARLGTPAYMAPEQLRTIGARADTRSDIFALGVLLGELVCGFRPGDSDGDAVVRDSVVGRAASRQIVRRAAIDPAAGAWVAMQRGFSSTGAHARRIVGDIDAIIAKATADHPDHRYQTVDALLQDIALHLRGEQISARSPTIASSAISLARRHRVSVAIALSCAVAVVAAGLLAMLSAFDARAQSRRAEAEMVRSGAVSAALRDVLAGIEPAVAKGRDRQLVVDMLEGARSRFEVASAGRDPIANGEVAAILGDAYLSLDLPDRALMLVDRGMSELAPRDAGVADFLQCLAQLMVVRGDAIARKVALEGGLVPMGGTPEPAFESWERAIEASERAGHPWSRVAIRARIRLWSADRVWPASADGGMLEAEIARHAQALEDADPLKWSFLLRRAEMSTWNQILVNLPEIIDRAGRKLGTDHPILIRARSRLLQYRVCAAVESQTNPREGVPKLDAIALADWWRQADEFGAQVVTEVELAFGVDHRLAQGARLWRLSARGYRYGSEPVRAEFDALRVDIRRVQGPESTALIQLDAAWLGALHGPQSGKWW